MSRPWFRAVPSAALALLAGGAFVLSHAQSGAPIRGDVNADGRITAVDALAILSYAVGKPLPEGFTAEPNGDANGDGQITAIDAQIGLSLTVGKNVSQFPIGTPLATFSADLASPGDIVVRQGGVATADVVLTLTGGFADTVRVTLEGLPTGVTSDTATLVAGATTATLNLAATIDATQGDTTATLRSRSSGHPDHTRLVGLKVVSAVHTLEIVPAFPHLDYDETIEIAAIARDVNGNILPGRHVAWTGGTTGLTPNEEEIVELPDEGDVIQITGVHEGTTSIFAVSDSVWATTQATVATAPVARVEVTGSSHELALWGTMQLTATPFTSRDRPLLNRRVSWSSSDASILEVDSTGLVTALSYGSATITATIDGTEGTFDMVVPEAPLAAVWIDPDIMTGRVGETGQFTATVVDRNWNEVTGYTVLWEVEDAEIATIDENGVLTARAAGSTLVMAWVEGRPEIMGTAELYVRPAVGDRLEVSTSGDGTGTVSVSPEMEYYPPGTLVTLTATPEAPSFFGGWSGCDSETTTCTLTMDGDMKVTASFRNTVQIRTAIATDFGKGQITRDPSYSSYPPGTTVTLTAVPGPYSVFREWYSNGLWDNDCEGTSPTCVLVTATEDLNAIAYIGARKWTTEVNGSFNVVDGACTYTVEFSEAILEFKRNDWKANVSLWGYRNSKDVSDGCSYGQSGGRLLINTAALDQEFSGSHLEGTMRDRNLFFTFEGEFVEDNEPFGATLTVEMRDQNGSVLGKGEIELSLTPE